MLPQNKSEKRMGRMRVKMEKVDYAENQLKS
jgi:hypothetical protein